MKKLILCILSCTIAAIGASAQWAAQSTNTTANLWDLQFINPNTGFAIGWVNSTSTFLKTIDGGENWSEKDMPGTYMFSTDFITQDTGYIAGYDFGCGCGYIRKTTDGGDTWADIHFSETFGLYHVLMKDQYNGWACGYQGRILTTHDGWFSHDTGSTGSNTIVFRELATAGKDTLYAGGGKDFSIQDQLYRSTDGGKTWNKIQNLASKFSMAGLYFLNGKTGFMAGNNGHDVIMKTTDGGLNWKAVYTGIYPSDLVDAVHFRGNAGYAVTSSGRILKSFDEGDTWTSEKSPTTHALFAVYMVNDNTGYAAGESGTLLKRMSSSGVDLPAPVAAWPGIAVFPDPFSDQATLKITLEKEGNTEIKLFDTQGKIIRTLLNGKLTAGTYEVPVARDDIRKGIYVIHLTTGTYSVARQIIIK